jgi:osmotically-inducible protein OsmY
MMNIDWRSDEPALSWLTLAGAFAVGAAVTWAAVEIADRLRPQRLPISDDTVLEHVRSRIGEVLGREDAVDVSVENGVVRLAGNIAPEERDALLTQLLYLPGVVRLRNALGVASS